MKVVALSITHKNPALLQAYPDECIISASLIDEDYNEIESHSGFSGLWAWWYAHGRSADVFVGEGLDYLKSLCKLYNQSYFLKGVHVVNVDDVVLGVLLKTFKYKFEYNVPAKDLYEYYERPTMPENKSSAYYIGCKMMVCLNIPEGRVEEIGSKHRHWVALNNV